MIRSFLFIACIGAVHGAQISAPQMQTPRAGVVRLQDGSVRELLGLPGSWLFGKTLFQGATAFSYSGAGGAIAFRDHVALLDAKLAVLSEQPLTGSALLNIDSDLASAVAWLSETKTFLVWNGSELMSVQASGVPEGMALTVHRRGDQAILVLQQSSAYVQATFSLASGDLVDCHAIADRPNVGEQMAAGWVHAPSATNDWAVQIGSGKRYEIPAPWSAQ